MYSTQIETPNSMSELTFNLISLTLAIMYLPHVMILLPMQKTPWPSQRTAPQTHASVTCLSMLLSGCLKAGLSEAVRRAGPAVEPSG